MHGYTVQEEPRHAISKGHKAHLHVPRDQCSLMWLMLCCCTRTLSHLYKVWQFFEDACPFCFTPLPCHDVSILTFRLLPRRSHTYYIVHTFAILWFQPWPLNNNNVFLGQVFSFFFIGNENNLMKNFLFSSSMSKAANIVILTQYFVFLKKIISTEIDEVSASDHCKD